ncbi:Alkanesulfonates ABC transporter ATP-binding protein / Sulfonate ABC transporter, ATP-binding subunit SsuB [methanotrophic endosymbiont of Bathymodiolus azoricus (Menez Gwen)]|nr:Alkanesulfonates ABC transporter ATP-binding protein / Sulfonate ABC transporter, ATP-binding subunit SsuB [methanotrophic endosymbiont of Bathymodiolus azoricus (Menez Gwen)]
MNNLTINILDKSYTTPTDKNSKQVIKNFQLNLANNEFICLVGPSGCGKTTLLNILAGLDETFSGNIALSESHTLPKVGYVFQNPRLLPWRTVQENIELASEAKIDTLDFLLESMGLAAERNTFPAHLSLGMSRRVAIIRAFAMDPDLLLMDEPFVSLDPPTARQAQQLLIDLWSKRPHKVLFVTHDLREAITLADRLIFLHSNPMSVIREIPVSIPRSERQNEVKIEQFRQQLFIDYPEITTLL